MEMDRLPKRRIIDAHCHIAAENNVPRSFIDGVIANMMAMLTAQGISPTREKLAKMYEKLLHDESCDELIAEMERAGVERCVLLAADFTYALKDCQLTIEETFFRHHRVMRRHPGKLEVFGGIDPRWGKDGVTLFERSLTELGFRGLKLYPPCGFSPSDRSLDPLYELCAHHRVPVLAHIGPTSPALSFDTANPFLLDDAARRFPNVDFILAHGAVSFTEECVMLCAYRPNVYLDVSGYQSALRTEGPDGPVRRIVSRGINHKIIFGTDWPVYRMQGDQRSFVQAITSDEGPLADLSDREADAILYGNVERLLARATATGKDGCTHA